jgi:hypothetical protein
MLFNSKITIAFLVCCLFSLTAFSNEPSHLDRQKLQMGCSTCHYKRNFKGGGGSAICIICHGDASRRTGQYKDMPKGYTPKVAMTKNIEAQFKKTYRHPTFDKQIVHRRGEVLPETDSRAPRHAVCVDCHNPHEVSPGNRFAGIKGKRVGNFIANISKEYELCYRCHADSANLPGRSTNKRLEFAISNPSFHPVEGEGKNSAVISLLKPYKEKKITPSDVSIITCGDCHGSDNPDDPAGPHGSTFQYILVDNYSTRDGEPESTHNYALCYRCHSRSSILANESFKYHSLHITGKTGFSSQGRGTSCYTCHSSHGSMDGKYLIRFNKDYVFPNSRGVLKFTEKGVSTFRGECYLKCHDVDHDPKRY